MAASPNSDIGDMYAAAAEAAGSMSGDCSLQLSLIDETELNKAKKSAREFQRQLMKLYNRTLTDTFGLNKDLSAEVLSAEENEEAQHQEENISEKTPTDTFGLNKDLSAEENEEAQHQEENISEKTPTDKFGLHNDLSAEVLSAEENEEAQHQEEDISENYDLPLEDDPDMHLEDFETWMSSPDLEFQCNHPFEDDLIVQEEDLEPEEPNGISSRNSKFKKSDPGTKKQVKKKNNSGKKSRKLAELTGETPKGTGTFHDFVASIADTPEKNIPGGKRCRFTNVTVDDEKITGMLDEFASIAATQKKICPGRKSCKVTKYNVKNCSVVLNSTPMKEFSHEAHGSGDGQFTPDHNFESLYRSLLQGGHKTCDTPPLPRLGLH